MDLDVLLEILFALGWNVTLRSDTEDGVLGWTCEVTPRFENTVQVYMCFATTTKAAVNGTFTLASGLDLSLLE